MNRVDPLPNETLESYIKRLNEQTRVWVAEDPKNRWAGILCEDPAYWAESNIHTVEDFMLDSLRNDIWEMYNTLRGHKPRHLSVWQMSYDEADALYKELREEYDRRLPALKKQWDAEAKELEAAGY